MRCLFDCPTGQRSLFRTAFAGSLVAGGCKHLIGGIMILTMELIMLVTGLYALFAGKMPTFGAAASMTSGAGPPGSSASSACAAPPFGGRRICSVAPDGRPGKGSQRQIVLLGQNRNRGGDRSGCAVAMHMMRLTYQTPVKAQQKPDHPFSDF